MKAIKLLKDYTRGVARIRIDQIITNFEDTNKIKDSKAIYCILKGFNSTHFEKDNKHANLIDSIVTTSKDNSTMHDKISIMMRYHLVV